MNSVSNLQVKGFSQLSDEEKLTVKTLGRPLPDLNIVQNIKTDKRQFKRVFKRDLYNNNDWLCGCEIENAFFCFPCLLFGGEATWTKSGVTDINHLSTKIKKHESSAAHIQNSLRLTLFGSVNVAAQLDSAYRRKISEYNEEVRHNRYVLNILINCIRFCGSFELALRGHEETELSSNPGVFRGLINFSSELDAALKSHMERATVFKGTSKTIQNELLQVMLEVCQEEIAKQIKEAEFLAIIADETSDISNIFQMAIVYRYVIKGKPVERFWGFLSPPQHDARTLATCIIEQLEIHRLNENPQKLIAQTYDGASVMAGSSGGVQAIVKSTYPNAEYVHCYAHQLNLVMSKAASINRNVKIFFSSLQGICTFFSNSPQRTAILDEVVKKRLPRACPTRWNFLSRSVNTVFHHKEDIIQCMNEILENDSIMSDSTICQALGQKKVLSSHNFNYWLKFFSKIMPLVDILYGQLQKREIEPSSAHKAISSFEDNIKKIRDQIDLSTSNEPTSSSSKKRKTDNTEWNREAKEVCDVVISQAKDRFGFSDHLVASSLFTPDKFSLYNSKFPERTLKTVCSTYKFLDKTKLHHELASIYLAEEFKSVSGAVSLLEFIMQNNLEKTLSESSKLLKLILTIPMTSAEAERCFSTLKRIKTFLRNSMTQERLSALAMLSIEKNLVMDIPDFNQRVIDKFASMNNRRANFLFK